MKKVGILVYDVSLTGGAERVAINISEELSKYYDIHLISLFDEKKFSTSKNYAFKVINDKTVKIPYHFFSLKNKLKKYLKKNKIEILLAITAGVNTLALGATMFTNIKVVYCEHSNLENKTYGKKHELRQLIGAKFSDKIVTLTDRDNGNFIKFFHVPKNKVVTISNWCNYSISKEKYDDKSQKIISVGRLEQVKGYDLLVEVAKKVKESHPNWHWDIYGEGSYREKIEKWIDSAKLKDFITLKGNVNNLSELYPKYSFLVMTSYYEGLSLTLLEAQASNLPVVSFDSPTGPAELIDNGVNGIIIPAYDTDEMANNINSLIDSVSARKNYSKNSKKDLDKFSKKNILKKWIDLIDSL